MRKLHLLVAAMATTLLSVLGVAGAAHAYTQTDSAGSYGSVGLPAAIADGNSLSITSQARYIGESPDYADSWQKVCVTHRLWQFVPGQLPSVPPRWQVSRHATNCGWIAPGQDGISDAGVVFGGLSIYSYYTADLVVTWSDSDGTLLGTTQVNYVDAGDYALLGPTRSLDRGGIAVAMFDI